MTARYYIALGAATTAGGTVTSAGALLTLDGVRAALVGDRVACRACATDGVIVADGARLPVRENGRDYALDGDLCLCQCIPSPRLLPTQQFAGQHAPADAPLSSFLAT